MQRGRKIASVVMLVVFATSNLFESFSYVFAQEENIETENQITVSETSDEGNNSDGDTAEDNFSDDEAADDESVNDETADDETADDETVDEAIVEPISSTIAGETLPTPETGNNETLPTPETGNNETLPTPETGSNETLPTPETGNNETLPTPETGNNETLLTPETGSNETLPTPETGSVIDDEMDIYDLVYTGVVEGKRYTVTLMDRNLGAESNNMNGEESYGRYYQWGNNYPFSHHTQLNHYTNERIDASGYGPNNRFRGENFIKGSNDWSTVSNDNLWGGEGDNGENDYYDIDANRQGPCPDGYHVPSVGEWYALLSSFLANNGLDLASTSGLSYSDYIGKERKAAYYLDSEYIENFKEIFNISYAGRIINGTLQRTGETAHLWTSTPLNGESLGFEVWDDHINLGGWETVRTTGYPIRCFKSVEYELIDYTITYVDEGEVTTETKHWGDILTEPEHTEKGTGYNRLGWYSRGLKFDFDTPVTGDLTLVSTWGCAEGYHLTGGQCESNIKVVDCIQTGKVENSKYIVTGSTITWDITGAKREEIPVCEWTCLDNYHLTGTQLTGGQLVWGQLTGVKCESNTKIVDCIQTGKVENSTYILSGVEITWDITGAKRNETPACEWVCNQHYHLNGDECAIDTFQFTLQENVNVDTSSSTQSGKKPYNSRVELNAMVNTGYRFMGWQILGLEGSGSSSTTIDSQVVFNMPDREVVATPLSEIIEYKIVYKNVDDAVVENPTTYTIETDTFTLKDPIRTGYTFLGWTGSNGLDPEKNIIITKGNYGNKKYSAVWQANTGVKYEVVHALEKANTTSYEEVGTEILSGTTDEMTEAVAKEYTGFTAKEIEQRVIRGDGSTVVRIMYDRNIYTITFDTDGGSEILPMTGKYGSNLAAPSDPTKGGYIFNGWNPSFPSTMPLSGAELVAQWRKRSGGGSSSSEETQVTTGTNETTTGQTNTGKVEEVVEEVENLDVDAGISGAPVINRPMKLGSVMLKALAQPQTKSAGGSATLLHGTGFNIMIKTLAGDSSPAYNSTNTTITQVLQASSIPSGVDTGVISAEDSESEIVAWFDDGTIYYYTDAGTIYMNEDSSYMFAGCSGLTGLNLSSWNTENVTTMYQMFGGCSSLENLNLDNWTINGSSNTIGGMFAGASNLKTVSMRNWTIPESFTDAMGCRASQLCATGIDFVDVSNWNFNGTNSLNGLFGNLKAKEIRGLGTWNTSGVTNMSSMFQGCINLTGLNLSGRNAGNVTTMYQMFQGCTGLVEVDMSNIDLGSISNMQAMFQGATELKKVKLSGITPKTLNIGGFFNQCSKIEELDLSNSDFSNVSFASFAYNLQGYSLKKINLSNSVFSGSMGGAFSSFTNLEELKLEGVNTSGVTNMNNMFFGCSKLTGLDLSSFDTSNVTNMNDMFDSCSNLEELDLSNFDTSNVTTSMGRMFGGCNKLENLNMSGWDFSKMGSFDISPMFWGSAGSLKKLDMTNAIFSGSLSFRSAPVLEEIKLDGVDTSNVTRMNELFRNDRNLTGLDLSSFDTSNVTNMSYMFEGCTGLTNLDLSSFDTSKVTNMGSMFYNMTNLKTIYVSTGFVTTAVTSSSDMFTNDTSLVGGNGTTYDVNHTDAEYARVDGQNGLSGYFTKSSTTTLLPGKEFNATIKSLAAGTTVAYDVTGTTITKIVQTGSIPSGVTTGLLSTEDSSYPIYGWFAGGIIYYYTEADKIYMNEDSSYMFNRLTKLNNLALNNWDTSRVTDMSYMFYYCSTLTSLSLSRWDTSKVTNMAYMFSFCSAATSWSFTSFDTSSVTNMTNMFYGDSKMKTLNLSGWDTSNVTTMHSMFNGCSALTTLTISSFDTSNVTDMAYMFQNCKVITTLNLSHFDTSNVTTMYAMFNGCEKLANLNVSGWNTSNVTDMAYMFQNCKAITTLNLSHFDTSNVTTMYQMFYTCTKLNNLNVSGWNTSKVTTMYAMFRGSTALGTLDLSSWDTSSVTNMAQMFYGCKNLANLNVSGWNTSNVTTMNNMFRDCNNALTNLNLSSWNTSKVTNMAEMFRGCSKLTTIYASEGFVTTAVTSPATNSKNMFYSNSAIVGGNGTKYNSSAANIDYRRAKIDKPGQVGYFTDASSAQLVAGTTFNATIKTLAGNAGATTGTENTNITKILQWTGNSIPSGVTTGLLSVSTSPYPVYGWYDNGTIYYYTEADNIYMGANSSYMFYNLKQVTELDIDTWNATKVANMAYMFGSCNNLESLDLSGWDIKNVTTLQGTFWECNGLQSLNVSTWNTANVTNMNRTFYDVLNLGALDVSGWNTAKVTNMEGVFYDCNALQDLDVSRWNTANVTNMSYMFIGCESLESLGVSNWNTANVTNMSYMFVNCSSLTGLDLSKWNTAKVTNMSNMFNNSTSLESLNVSNWDTSSVTDMSDIFTDCNSLTELNLGSWNTSSLTDSSNMFYACDTLETIYASDKFVVSGSVNSSNMFGGCISLVGGNDTEFDENHIDGEYARIDGKNGLSGYFTESKTILLPGQQFNVVAKNLAGQSNANYYTTNTSITQIVQTGSIPAGADTRFLSVENSIYPVYGWFTGGILYYYTEAGTIYLNSDSSYMFEYMRQLTGLDLSSWDTSNVTRMNGMFYDCTNLSRLDLSNWDTSNVTGMNSMFAYDEKLVEIKGLDTWDTSNVTNMYEVFYLCKSLIGIDLSSWDTSNVTNMRGMFDACSALTGLDLSSWDTSNVTNMDYMFYYCSSLKTLDVSNWDIRKVTAIGNIFAGCSSLTGLDLSNWDTSNLTSMSSMFSNCSKLMTLDVSSWDTSNVTSMSSMFSSCSKLTGLDLSSWDTSNVTSMSSMFSSCSNLETIYVGTGFIVDQAEFSTSMFYGDTKLVGGNGTTFDSGYIDKTYAKIDNQSQSGYFTDKTDNILVRFMVYPETFMTQLVPYGHTATRPVNNPTRVGTTFKSWVRPSSQEYNFDNDRIEKYTELYATFNTDGATLLPGIEFNQTIKKLAGQIDATYGTTNTNIKKIVQWTESIPEGVITGVISLPYSDNKVIAWFTGGILYYYTDAETIYLNPDSSYIFNNLQGLTGIDLSNWDTSNVTNMRNMFSNCSNLTGIDLSNFNTSNVTNMSYMFSSCSGLQNLDLSNFNTSKVTDMSYMFNNMRGLISLDLNEFDTSNVTGMSAMFSNCSNLTGIDLNNFDTSSVTNMSSMFYGCSGLTGIDLSNFDTSSVTNMSSMFYGCSGLTGIDLSNFDTSSVTDMSSMFYQCNNLTQLDLRSFDTSNVTNMYQMFEYCRNLTGINLSNFDTSKVTNMTYMFYQCNNLTELDVSNFDTSNVTSMGYMFSYCYNLRTIYASTGFETKKATYFSSMFQTDSKIVGGNGTKFDSSKDGKEYAKLDNELQLGYFTDKNAINVRFLVDQDEYQIQSLTVGQKALRPENPVKTGATFVGWIDSNGDEYDFDTIVKGYVELYAKFSGGSSAIFMQGKQFNVALKKLSGQSNISYGNYNTTIKQIVRAGNIPVGATTTGISAPYSDKEIVAWYDSGIIYYYTEADAILLNKDSSNMFNEFEGLTGLDMSGWDTSSVTDMSHMFEDCVNLIGIDLSDFDTSKVTNMSYMFYYCRNLTDLDVSGLDTSSVIDMSYMFYYCDKLTGLNLSTFNTSKVTDMSYMFYRCEGLNYLNMSGWNTSEVTDMNNMFYRNISLSELDVSHFDTSKVTNMKYMFLACTGVTHLDLSNFNTSNVTDMYGMFHSCSSLTGLDLSNFDTSKVRDMGNMFIYCYDLEELNLSGWDFRKFTNLYRLKSNLFQYSDGIKKLDLTNTKFPGTSTRYLLEDMNSLEELKMGGADMSNITDISYMFEECTNLKRIDVSNWDISNVKNMGGLFIRCGKLVEIKGLDTWNTSSATTMQAMFYQCSSLTGLDLSNWNTSNVTSISSIVYNCTGLEELNLSGWDLSKVSYISASSWGWNNDVPLKKLNMTNTKFSGSMYDVFYGMKNLEELILDGIDTTRVTSMNSLFNQSDKLTSLDLSSFDTSEVTDMYDMFYYCSGLVEIKGLETFDTTNVTSMGDMFAGCSNLTGLDLGSFDTRNVTSMYEMFYNTPNLKTIYASDKFVTTALTGSYSSGSMFTGDVSLVGGNGTTYDPNHIDAEYARIDGRGGLPGYFTDINDKYNILLEATATEANQTLKINKYFANAYTVDWGDGSPIETVSADKTHTYTGTGTYTITLSTSVNRWTFQNVSKPLVPTNGTTVTDVKIVSMPSLADGFGNSETNPGNYFFYYFNRNGALTSLPSGSFDTSKITTVGNYFFSNFNYNGQLTSLPSGSFDTSKITTVGDSFFSSFNLNGELTSLPSGSFDTSKITTVGNSFFSAFNSNGELTSLPEGSFDTSKITTVGDSFFSNFNGYGQLTSLPEGSFRLSTGLTTVGNGFFSSFNSNGELTSLPEGSFRLSTGLTTVGNGFFSDFNYRGKLTSLPAGSFDTSNITTVGYSFFSDFNLNGAITSLPEGSFDTSNITTVGDYFFRSFNYNGKLTSLPSGSFDTSNITTVGNYFFYRFNENGLLTSLPSGSFDTSNITTVGNDFFNNFNYNGKLTSLPAGSFDTSNITTVGNYFFSNFNYGGALTSLPAGSFDTSNITSGGNNFFYYFNYNGRLTSLPEGSFDMSNITTAGTYFLYYFNYNGRITDLPESFKLTSAAYNKNYSYTNAFNSTGYTINRKVSDLVSGVTAPLEDRDVFSDNQPGRCGVHENWLVTTADACSITYDDGQGGTGQLKYDANTMSVAVGSGIIPARTGYMFLGWANASGETINHVTFPEMDGQTIYAQWTEVYTITYNLNGGTGGYSNPTTYTVYSGEIQLERPIRTGYMFIGWLNNEDLKTKPDRVIPAGSTGNKVYAALWLPFDDLNVYLLSNTGNVTNYILMDRNMGAISTNIEDADSYGKYYKWGNNQRLNGNESNWSSIPTGTWSQKDQGPCPEGYHLPDKSDLIGLGYDWVRAKGLTPPSSEFGNLFDDNTLLLALRQDLLVSLAGGKSSSNGTLYGTDQYVNWHSSEPYSQEKDYTMWFSQLESERLSRLGNTNKNSGYPVRCFKDVYTPIMTIHSNGGTGAVVVFTGAVGNGKITSLGTPKRGAHSIFEGWYSTSGFDAGSEVIMGSNVPTGLYAKWSCDSVGFKDNGTDCVLNKDIILEATTTSTGKTIAINKYFSNAYTVDWGDGNPVETVSANKTHTYTGDGTYTITLSLTGSATRWTFYQNDTLVPKAGTDMTGVKITYMPSLADGFGANATNPGNNFFRNFNRNGAITSLPDGSFDTSNITTVGTYFFLAFNQNGLLTSLPDGSFRLSTGLTTAGGIFFAQFNCSGLLTSLPDGSFNTENITSVGEKFFNMFNQAGQLTSLPTGSFNIENITSVGTYFFNQFNNSGALTSLPEGSFRFSTGLRTIGNNFFSYFNLNGALTSLPEGSFNTENITSVGTYFFISFNENGQLTRLSTGSFNTENITSVGSYFFSRFNTSGSLTSLPEGSFRFSTGLTSAKKHFFSAFNMGGQLTRLSTGSFNTDNIVSAEDVFFQQFNSFGALESLPEGSFDISNITTVGNYFFTHFNKEGKLASLPGGSFRFSTGLVTVGTDFFQSFNYSGAITALPEGSFNTENIKKVGIYFFSVFNYSGALTSLPTGSFNTENITTAGNYFFAWFNGDGAITTLPDSFTVNSIGTSSMTGYYDAFNSTGYTINRKVSDLVSGVTVPSSDMDVFSDNQPGRCGVHPNWLVTTADACSISYDDGLGGTGEFKYTADTTGVEVGSGITLPMVEGYTFGGWYTASGVRVDEVSFPELDGQTLYARWIDNVEPTVSADNDGVWWNENITITLSVSDDNLDYAKYSRVSSGDCVSSGTSFASGDTITYATEGTGTLYLCASDVAGNIGTWSGVYYLDKTRPAITFDQQSGAAAKSHSVEITATDTGSKLVGGDENTQSLGGDERNTATYSSGADGYTVTYNGKSYTLALNDLPGTYKWGNNIAGDSTNYNGVENNNRWGGASDNADNGFNPNPTNFDERQGPCGDGYHVPSRGEWNALVVAWCHLNSNSCTESDLQHASEWTVSNNLIRTTKSGLGRKFKSDFSVSDDYLWSSSPSLDNINVAWSFDLDDGIYPNNGYDRDDDYLVRCFKNSTSETTTLNYRWQLDSTCSSDESDYTSTSRDPYENGDTTATATVTTSGLDDGSYYLCVLSGSAVDNAGNTNITTKTSGQFVVDNTAPIGGTFTINNGAEYTNNTSVKLNTTCPTDVGDGTVQVAYGSTANPTNWTTCSGAMNFTLPSGDGEKTVYMRFRDGLGNTTNDVTDTIILDTTAPVCTWGEPGKPLIRGGQTGTIVLTCTDNIGIAGEPHIPWINYGSIVGGDDVILLSDPVIGGTITGRTYAYTYTGILGVNGQTIIDFDRRASVQDLASNSCGSSEYSSEIRVDNTPPTLSADKSSDSWYTGDITITLTSSDTNGLNYAKYSRTSESDCVNNGTSFDSGDMIEYNTEGNRTLYLCAEDNAGNTATWTGTYKLDKTDPVCGTWTYEPPLNTWTNGSVVATLTGSTDATAGIQTGGGSCNISTYNGTCSITISDKAGRTTVCTSSGATNIDLEVPTATITTTSTLKTGSQVATLSCSDNVGVTSYYWGSDATPSLGDYTNVTSITSFTTTKNVTSAGTYYLYCKDAAGNVSDVVSQTYNSYEVHNMLNAVDKAEGTYNTANYPQSSTYTYIAPSSTIITFADIYTVPTYSAVNQYKGWSSSASTTATTTSESETLNGNQVYYFWFDRTKYNLKMTKNTGIATIYYKINGATDWSSTTVTKTVSMKAGSDASVYAEASNCYTYTATSSTNPQSWTNITAAKSFSPTATENTNNITYNLNGGTNNENNPATYKITQLPITLQQPTRTGYTFKGWTGANGNTPQTGVTIAGGTCGAKTYNATWQANTYKISYTMNGGSYGTNHPTTATYDTAFTVNNPTRDGYTFSGWKITGMDGVTHTYGTQTTTATSISSTKETSFKNLHSTSGATVTFTAQWTINQYNVMLLVNEEGWGTLSIDISGKYNYGAGISTSFGHLQLGRCPGHVGGGTNSINDPIISMLSVKAIPGGGNESGVCNYTDATPTESNVQYTYAFSGWNNECGDTVTHDCTITAEFTRTLNSYDVTFNSNGGTPIPATQNIYYGSKATRSSDPTRTGYAFGGWTLNGSDFDFNTGITGAITLVAKWNLVDYTITYNLNGGTETVANPTSYTVESGAITLHSPSKAGYTFIGWTGSNGTTPQTGVIIPSGSTGDRIYNATWQANTNTPYTVYHYVKKVGSGTYELALTEPKQGTSDAILTLSSLAKADGFVCATYDRGSLTGTESGPGEIVTQTIIRGDGSTKIYLYYTRNNRTVHLSGDEHVDYLEINGFVDDEAERECGSEVPVNAIPKPGYHFVRWRERTEEEEEEKNG